MNQKGLAPILIVIILATLVGGYLLYQKQYKPTPPTPQPTTQPSLTPSDETANWKTYVNSKLLYSFKYPNDYVVSENEKWTTISNPKGLSDPKSNAPYNSLTVFVSNEGCVNIDPLTYKQYAPTLEEVNVSGAPGKRWSGNSVTFADPFFGDIIIQTDKSSKCYKLFFVRDPENKGKSEAFLTKILSAFKFTEKSSSNPAFVASLSDVNDWKTYSFNFERYAGYTGKYNVQFSYPQEWMVEEVSRQKSEISDCIEYKISSEDKNVQISLKSICKAYYAKSSPFPKDGVVIKNTGSGDDLRVENYVVRFFDNSTQEFKYIDVLVPTNSFAGNSDNVAHDSLIIKHQPYQPHNAMFSTISLRYSGPDSKRDEYIKQADTIIHSLKLK